jgi:hypothetical protein
MKQIAINVRKPEFEVKNFFAKSATLLITRSMVMAAIDNISMPNKNRFEP